MTVGGSSSDSSSGKEVDLLRPSGVRSSEKNQTGLLTPRDDVIINKDGWHAHRLHINQSTKPLQQKKIREIEVKTGLIFHREMTTMR